MLVILAAIFLGNVVSVLCAAALLLAEERLRARLMPWLLNFSAGALLCAGFAGVLPEAMEQALPKPVMTAFLCGIVFFYFLEKSLLWRHCHKAHCELHQASGYIIIIGDSVHNFMDGIAVAAAFSQSAALGIGTALAVFAHELPQEVGDFAILLHGGFSRSRAFFWNVFSGLVALLGGVSAWLAIDRVQSAAPYALAFAAASMIYVAMADLLPSLRSSRPGEKHFLAFLGGAALLLWLTL